MIERSGHCAIGKSNPLLARSREAAKIAVNSLLPSTETLSFQSEQFQIRSLSSNHKIASSDFLHHDTHLSDKLRFRSRPAGRSIICSDRCLASQQLLAEHLTIRPVRQRTKQADHSQCERLLSDLEAALAAAHWSTLLNRPITRSPNHSMPIGLFLPARCRWIRSPPRHLPAAAPRTSSAASGDSRSTRTACVPDRVWPCRH